MDQQLLNTLLAILALLATIGNVVAFGVTRFEVRMQRKDTKDLARIASELQYRVNALSVALDQHVSSLNRARDLVNNVYLTYRSSAAKHLRGVITMDDNVQLETVIGGSFVELLALGDVIDDQELMFDIIQFQQETIRFGNSSNKEIYEHTEAKEWAEALILMDARARKLHRRIYYLLKNTSKK